MNNAKTKLEQYSWGTLRVVETGSHTIVIHPGDWETIAAAIQLGSSPDGDWWTMTSFEGECGTIWSVTFDKSDSSIFFRKGGRRIARVLASDLGFIA